MASPSALPSVPERHAKFIPYLKSNPNTPLQELLEPYKQYDAKLREVFAQEPNHPALADEHLNVVPVFDGHQRELKIQARDLDAETPEEKAKYVMPLEADDRRPNGASAIVEDFKDFKQNFALFCESSLVDLDWSNVVAAGSSVVTCLLPVPDKYKKSKRALRQYYHDMVAPASDVDLFLYGLSEADAVKKVIEIEQRIKDSILTETTTIRTKNAITIASQYPTRHIQIVLRMYKSVSEILTGFDVDCSCAAFDGNQVWASPRALTAYMTQTNTIDLTRRSPSYENRLSKYSHRGFEVYWPLLERSRIDPTIFERNFGRTVGLARLLVLERLPTKSEREAYMDERRRERGRPRINRPYRYATQDNIKERYEDEVAEWVDQEDVSDYHTFTIPYGPKFHAKKIEKLLYTKDLLLNAEWNKRDDREVNLHRHPAFFGYAEDVIHDCCGFCPKPVTPEEHDVAEEEAKIYVSGEITFLKDDPGRQAIGSFNPITDDDWTEMAYVGNTARLCQAIIDQDLEHVEDWLSQEGSDPNCRDYTGRTPLHLAVTSSSPEIVEALINHGARLVARLADGRTALHLAAARGNVEMVRVILQKSEENEEEEAKKEDFRKQTRMAVRAHIDVPLDDSKRSSGSDDEDNDLEVVENENDDSDEDARTNITESSFVKVKEEAKKADDPVLEDDEDEPDVYDVNVFAWDTHCSPLHLAILNGHIDVVKELVQTFGADVLLPVKLFNDYDKSPRGAILTLVLALGLPLEQAKAMTRALLEVGASSAQADMQQTTALHYITTSKPELFETLLQHDEPSAKSAINHLSVSGSQWAPWAQSPLMSAILQRNALAALKLLGGGAAPSIEFKDWIKSVEAQYSEVSKTNSEQNRSNFETCLEQPIILSVQAELPEVTLRLLEQGVSPNTLPKGSQQALHQSWYSYNPLESLLDLVRKKIADLRSSKDHTAPTEPEIRLNPAVNYLEGIEPGTYKHFRASISLESQQQIEKSTLEFYEGRLKEYEERGGVDERRAALEALAREFEQVEEMLVSKGAKTFKELYPDKASNEQQNLYGSYQPPPMQPWSLDLNFSIHDLTDEKREAYLKLFQAAWDGDLDIIKSLTLASWGEGNNTPLKISVQDGFQHTPFSIAILRGHLDVARAIVEICYAQYQPPDEDTPKARYRLGNEGDDDASDTSDVPVYQDIIDDKFTIDNIGELSTQVKSEVSPLSFMALACNVWNYATYALKDKNFTCGVDDRIVDNIDSGNLSLQSWAITTNDKTLFSFLLDLDIEWTDRLAKDLDGSSGIPSFAEADFDLAVQHGRVHMLAEMIKHGGAGMELESLVKKSGVKYREKPKFYQGLSVHGKKRADWVSAARGTYVQSVTDSSPPLLEAAFKGNLQTVEWFMSDTPARHYLDFAEAYKGDKLISHLNTAAGGFDKVLMEWLGARRELALHCAVMAPPRPETLKLIEYLIKVMPASLELKSADGYTPLALAFSLHRFDAAMVLIGAGADQSVRDKMGSNILHLLLSPAYMNGGALKKDTLEPMLDLIDKRLAPSLMTERSANEPGSLTPLANWMRRVNNDAVDVLRVLLDFAAPYGNEHLELLDGSGETPLHYCVMSARHAWLEVMLEFRPDLLYRENSVGRTPYELAEDAYISECVFDVPSAITRHIPASITTRPASAFVPESNTRQHDSKKSTWRFCEEFAKAHPGKRRLVSLLDANEVAKRLAKRQAGRQYGRRPKRVKGEVESDAGSDDGETDSLGDEVRAWYLSAPSYISPGGSTSFGGVPRMGFNGRFYVPY